LHGIGKSLEMKINLNKRFGIIRKKKLLENDYELILNILGEYSLNRLYLIDCWECFQKSIIWQIMGVALYNPNKWLSLMHASEQAAIDYETRQIENGVSI